ncbi:MAG: GerW family sporulation protein [Bacillota bacterium]
MAMEPHPIEGLMRTAMESIKEMIDVNVVVGDPVETPDGTVVIPVSRVALGFAAGGAEFEVDKGEEETVFPFGGGSGAGVSVQPVGFLVIGKDQVRLIPVDANVIADRLIDLAPQVLDKIDALIKRSEPKKEQPPQ